ncbi:MAG: hypothetical protein BV457_06775 [Thermoplasmata archaeon M9B1D]|nr:MAG: hypothetical protein BV457_06775 [Thermoplasmata archaeon M9B1D]
MKKSLLKKISIISITFLLIGVIFNPIIGSKEINEEKNEKIILNLLLPGSNENKIFSLNKEDFNLLKSLISDIIQNIASGKKMNENWIDPIIQLNAPDNNILIGLINLLKDLFEKLNGQYQISKKTLIISQGWSYNFNLNKNSEFKIKRSILSFWHYTYGSVKGGKSTTLVIRPNTIFSSKGAELYKEKQIGFMYKPTGIYIYQKDMFPKKSYTLFIGFADNVFASAAVEADLNLPLM